MNLGLIVRDNEIIVSSRSVADAYEKRHDSVIRKIEDFIKIIPDLTDHNFVVSNYLDASGKSNKEYMMDRQGFSILANKFTGDKALLFTYQYTKTFEEMADTIKQTRLSLSREQEIQLQMFQAKSKEEVILLAAELNNIHHETIDRLDNEIDKYSRFLCDNLSTLTKTELAIKLDTKPQTLAALLKKLNVYTPKASQINGEFLKKYEHIKMIKDVSHTYTNPNTGELKTKVDWQWTYEGSKALVDYLFELGKVSFCDNKGFKLIN